MAWTKAFLKLNAWYLQRFMHRQTVFILIQDVPRLTKENLLTVL